MGQTAFMLAQGAGGGTRILEAIVSEANDEHQLHLASPLLLWLLSLPPARVSR